MKSAAAFALGLWTGAVLIGAVGTHYFRVLDQARLDASPQVREKIETRVQLLQQEQARAAAEATRLKETVAELKSNLAAQTSVEVRRLPRAVRLPEAPAEEPAGENWISGAVATGDTAALPRLEAEAVAGDDVALDAVALLADRDNGEALLNVWNAPAANAVTKVRATRLIAASLEVIPSAIELLTALFFAAQPDPNLLEAALRGLGTPEFTTKLTADASVEPPPHFVPNYALRLRVLDTVRPAVTDERLLALLNRSQNRLVQHAAEGEPAAP
jgi:hypothetical protein